MRAENIFFARLKQAVVKRRQEIIEEMGRGMEPDTYRKMVGYLEGMSEVEALADNINNSLLRDQ